MAYRIRDWDRLFENNRTRELKRIEWVPVPNKMDGSGYTELVDHERGDAHLGAWYAILEISSRQKVRGTIPQESAADRGDIPQDLAATCRCLSRVSRLPAKTFTEVIPRLLQIGWIEEVETARNVRDREIPQNPAPSCGKVTTRAREWNGMEGNGREENLGASAPPTETLFPADLASPVRSVVPAEPTFEDWWKVWWNPTAKAKTKKLWPAKAKQYGAQFLIDAAVADRQRFEPTTSWEWRSQLHPTTWLNGKRWEDQLPPNGKSSTAPNGKAPMSVADRALQTMLDRASKGLRPA